jgi:hypothetical protein
VTDAELAAAITALVDSDVDPPVEWRGDTRELFVLVSWPDTYDELVAAVLRVYPILDLEDLASFRIAQGTPPHGVGAYEQPTLRPYTSQVTPPDVELDRITITVTQPPLPLGV